MRPRIGIVPAITVFSRLGWPALRIALMPRSDIAKLIDFVKFKGIVPGLRKSSFLLDSKVLHKH